MFFRRRAAVALALSATLASAPGIGRDLQQPAQLAGPCARGVLHVALLSPAQMCPRPLATTPMQQRRPADAHT